MKLDTFGERFEWAYTQDKRAPENKSHRSLGKYFGVSGTMIGYFRNNEKLPSTETAINISLKTGVSVEYLLTGRGSRYVTSSSSSEPPVKYNNQSLPIKTVVWVFETMDYAYKKLSIDVGNVTSKEKAELFADLYQLYVRDPQVMTLSPEMALELAKFDMDT